MIDSPTYNLVDQNMVCGSNTDQRDHFSRIHLDVSRDTSDLYPYFSL